MVRIEVDWHLKKLAHLSSFNAMLPAPAKITSVP